MKYKCIIIDDESHAIEGLERYIGTLPELEVVKTYSDSLIALKEIVNGPNVDIIFLDVDMPVINGLELAKEIGRKTNKLIFTTGHTEYAYEAFESHADAYLLKPFSLGKFTITINKLFPDQSDNENVLFSHGSEKSDDFFFVKSKSERLKLIKIRFDDVVAVESKMNYLLIFTLKDEFLTYISLSEISKTLLMHPQFIQPHRSFIINRNHIESIEGNTIKMVSNLKIAIGEHYKKNVSDFIAVKVIKGAKK
ncbi:MAG: response regulator transcription factor [Chitinophagaceae bacterium]|nr:MAG: response regulator transcription factor [Chitinophagaceae bacterium]